jgi:aspartate kinase
VQLDLDQSRVTLQNIPDQPGIAAQLFTANGTAGVNVDMIVQNVSQSGHAHITFTVPRSDLDKSLTACREVLKKWPESQVTFEKEIAKLSVMGVGLRSHTGVGEKTFKALGEAAVNVQLISTSEVRISFVVSPQQSENALKCLLAAFGLPPVDVK